MALEFKDSHLTLFTVGELKSIKMFKEIDISLKHVIIKSFFHLSDRSRARCEGKQYTELTLPIHLYFAFLQYLRAARSDDANAEFLYFKFYIFSFLFYILYFLFYILCVLFLTFFFMFPLLLFVIVSVFLMRMGSQ